MPPGPILIFDKSFLQSLNVDEAVWLDNFFLTVITPLFFVETLADLEKEVHRGRMPEQVVGGLAYKTPDLQSHIVTHHGTILWAELNGNTIPLDGRVPRPGGRLVELDGKHGVTYQQSKEEEALARWQKGEFLDLERQIAKVWRRNVTNIDHSANYALFKEFYGSFRKPKTLADAKYIADTLIDLLEEEKAIRFGLALLGVPIEDYDDVVARWAAGGKRPIGEFAPYFRHMFSVDLFFQLAVAADLISRVRPAGKADNKVDIAYLYYLPFCMVFVSSDNLHKRTVPLFLRSDQSFVEGPDLKADLKRIDDHYAQLPKEQTDNDIGESRSGHAGKMANSLQSLRLERDNLFRLRISLSAQKVPHGQDISRSAAKIDRAKSEKALKEKPGTNQQNDRKCELDGQEALAQ
jgi:hypothetical protein